MSYNPKIHDRKSIRLKGYDYSKAGLYFITICCQDRVHCFGHVKNGMMILNDAGRMIEKWYWELENKYPDKRCHEMLVMPNHFHCIVENLDNGIPDAHVVVPLSGRPDINDGRPDGTDVHPIYGPRNQKTNATIGDAMDWFKTMTTNEYILGVKTLNWPPFNRKLWQRNYYEHIIRCEQAYQRITDYIIANPANWKEDKFFL